MRKFTFNPLVLAMAACVIPLSAQAQDNALEEIVVTGSYRASLASALDVKRNSANAVDSIKAEDIADFPDNNLAESLQRIPGVAITRSGGEGRGISVRGLGPDYTRVRINGVEAISTTGGTDATGGTNRSRGFDFNTFSSDLFSNLTVNKTAMASIEEGSLGATVDLKTAQPFDYNDFVFTSSAQLGYNESAEESDPTAAFLISNVFADGKLGALFSLSYSERSVRDEGSSTVRWANAANQSFGSLDGTAITSAHPANTAFHPRIPRYDSFNHNIERTGASLSLQARPTDTTEISLDALYANHKATRQEVFWEASLNTTQNAAVNINQYEIDGNSLVYADMSNVRLLAENRFDEMETKFNQVTLNVKQDFTDSLKGNLTIGSVKSDFDNPLQNTAIMRADGMDFSYDFRDGKKGDFVFGDEAYVASSWTLTEMRQRPQASVNEFQNVLADIEYTINDALTFKAGLNHKKFEFSTTELRLKSEAAPAGVNLNDYLISYDSGLGNGGAWLIPDRAAIASDFDIFSRGYNVQNGNTYQSEEETTGGFIQLDFNSTIGETPVRGNIGLRQFSTEQSTTGWLGGNQIWVDHKYDDVLPSANVALEPIENVIIRLAYSEGIARAGLGSIKADTSVSVAGTTMGVTGSNPFLEPTKAKSYDVGVEMYFDNESALAMTVFRKDVESQVQTYRTTRNFQDIISGFSAEEQAALSQMADSQCAASSLTAADCNTSAMWNYTLPLNAPGGDLYGFEVSYQTPFSFLPGFLQDFGFIGSYTYVKGEIAYLDATGAVEFVSDLENMSINTSSATLYYEKDAFQARASLASRTGYITNARGRDGNSAEGTRATYNLDASASYQINDNWRVSLEALNLTNEADNQWVDSDDYRTSYYHETGRQYYLGVQYKY
jgi:iron complex outermembrane receptor protein